eukprot:3934834-Rhodomonas_salina.1
MAGTLIESAQNQIDSAAFRVQAVLSRRRMSLIQVDRLPQCIGHYRDLPHERVAPYLLSYAPARRCT